MDLAVRRGQVYMHACVRVCIIHISNQLQVAKGQRPCDKLVPSKVGKL